jgi:predicted phosphate transport protein (TIGR00153 family)
MQSYFRVSGETMQDFQAAVEEMLRNGFTEHFAVLVGKTSRSESTADDFRRMIEADMFEQSLLPETREDILDVLEMIDQIPSEAKKIIKLLHVQGVLPLVDIQPSIRELVLLSVESFSWVIGATRIALGMEPGDIRDIARRVKTNESLGDSLEYDMIRNVFLLPIHTGDRLLQRDMIRQIGFLCNLCETASDRILILCIKRRI